MGGDWYGVGGVFCSEFAFFTIKNAHLLNFWSSKVPLKLDGKENNPLVYNLRFN